MFDPHRVGQDLDQARRTFGGRNWPKTFSDRLTSPLPGGWDVVRMLREMPNGRALADVARIPVTPRAALPPAEPGTTDVTWIGHATFVVRIGGLTILTDPVWSRRIPGVRPRLTPPGVPLDGIGRIDAVVISHNHYDHLDAPTIRRLPRDVPVFVPAMLGWWFRRRNFRQVIELDWWESVPLGEVDVDFVPAHHWSRRTLTDTCKSLWGGWIFTARRDSAVGYADTRVYFAGDTGYGHWFTDIGARYPGIDLALMPVGAYEPNWFMKPVHMNPQEAVRACDDLGARRMATMHWGTFLLSAEPLLDPVDTAVEAWTAAGRSRDDLWDLAVGESRALPPAG
ncbi:MAG TPA: MBL fold metallo-hydrolase [Micromonosporaceae bacterium]